MGSCMAVRAAMARAAASGVPVRFLLILTPSLTMMVSACAAVAEGSSLFPSGAPQFDGIWVGRNRLRSDREPGNGAGWRLCGG